MVRVAVILVTLVAQVFSICAQRAFVLCVHHDGQTMIEFAWATCCSNDQSRCHCGVPYTAQEKPEDCDDECREQRSGCDCGCSHRETGSAERNGKPDAPPSSVNGRCDHCTDYPIDISFVSVLPETRNRQIEADRPDTFLASDPLVGSIHLAPLDQHGDWKCCGPPGVGAPPHIRTTILRC